MGKWLSIFSVLFVSFSPTESFAQKADPFETGVNALRAQEYKKAKTHLLDAKKASNDPRVDYYLGFAHEKLVECERAKSLYQTAAR